MDAMLDSFATLVEAKSNEQVAKFSIELGVKAGVHITTLPAVPISRLEEGGGKRSARAAVELTEAEALPDGPP